MGRNESWKASDIHFVNMDMHTNRKLCRMDMETEKQDRVYNAVYTCCFNYCNTYLCNVFQEQINLFWSTAEKLGTGSLQDQGLPNLQCPAYYFAS